MLHILADNLEYVSMDVQQLLKDIGGYRLEQKALINLIRSKSTQLRRKLDDAYNGGNETLEDFCEASDSVKELLDNIFEL